MCIVQLSLPYRPVLSLAYPPPYRPALQAFCPPALLSLPYWPGRTVALPYRPVLSLAYPPPLPTCPAALLTARSSFLAVLAWAHGEEQTAIPYRHATPCLPCLAALLSLPYRPGRTVRGSTAIPYRHATSCAFNPPLIPPLRVARKSARVGNIRARHLTTKT